MEQKFFGLSSSTIQKSAEHYMSVTYYDILLGFVDYIALVKLY